MTTIVALGLYVLVPAKFLRLSSSELNGWFSRLFLYTVVVRFLSILLFKITGLISNAKMHNPKDRVLPLIATMVFYSVAYGILVLRYHLFGLFQSLLLGSCMAIFIILIINFFYKVSVHTTAAGILPGVCIVFAMSQVTTAIVPALMALFIAIVVGAIRWFLGSHTIGQILLGYIVGISTQVAAYIALNT